MNALPLHSAFLNSTSLSHDAAPVIRSIFSRDAHALIYQPARSPMTSAPLRRQGWKLRFERRSPLRIGPLRTRDLQDDGGDDFCGRPTTYPPNRLTSFEPLAASICWPVKSEPPLNPIVMRFLTRCAACFSLE